MLRSIDLKEFVEFGIHNKDYVINSVKLNFINGALITTPLIVKREFHKDYLFCKEVYGPVFNIIVYSNEMELLSYFKSKKYINHAMYISVFGDLNIENELFYIPFLHNKVVADVDVGYNEYGGYGKYTSFLVYKGIMISKPLLVNREINEILGNGIFTTNSKYKNSRLLKKEIIVQMLKEKILFYFKDNVLFSFIFGSFVKENYKTESADIDIFICLKERNDKEEKQFKKWYIDMHYLFGMIPDFVYPAEIITYSELINIINKSESININILNDNFAYDSVFLTQIILDEKKLLIGKELYRDFEYNFMEKLKLNSSRWCEQIVFMIKNNYPKLYQAKHNKINYLLYNNDLDTLCSYVYFDEKMSVDFNDYIKNIDKGFLNLLYSQQLKKLNYNGGNKCL